MKIGPYEVVKTLGRGGMGVVLEGRAPSGEVVAIKILREATADRLARFERERRLIGLFTARDGFVPLLDAGVAPEGPYLVMPLLRGGTLRDRLERGPLGVEETLALGRVLAAALARAHEKGIIHRDLKPENVLFFAPSGDAPLIADLGLAKHFDVRAPGASQSVSLSSAGQVRGTAGYMAPEQLADAKGVGPEADVFALGAILHECLVGRPAYEGSSFVELFTRIAAGPPPAVRTERRDVPAWLSDAILRALAREPSGRFADGRALLAALEARGRSARSRRRAAVLLLAVAAVVVAVLAALRATSAPRPAPAAPPGPAARPPLAAAELVERARKKRGEGDIEGALADLGRAIALEPARASHWCDRGSALSSQGRTEAALADFTKAIELDGGLAIAWANRALAKSKRADRDGSIADATRAVELDPKLAVAWEVRARSRTVKGEHPVEDWGRYLELVPEDADGWSHCGLARTQLGDLAGAVSDFDRAIRLDAEKWIAWNGRSEARTRLGDLRGALDDLEHVIANAPESVMKLYASANAERIRTLMAASR